VLESGLGLDLGGIKSGTSLDTVRINSPEICIFPAHQIRPDSPSGTTHSTSSEQTTADACPCIHYTAAVKVICVRMTANPGLKTKVRARRKNIGLYAYRYDPLRGDSMPELAVHALDVRVPPSYCEYAGGPCDQSFLGMLPSSSLFLFSQHPSEISSTIESSVEKLRTMVSSRRWITWKNLDVPGQIIFCEICKAMRYTDVVVADVTTLNFNLMFEIGFAIGLGLPVIPIRNTKFIEDKHQFDELGILDTLGYFDFQTSNDLKDLLIANSTWPRLRVNVPALNNESPLYVVKSPVDSDGTIKMMSVIKKSRLQFRLLDTRETGRVSLHEVYKNTLCSRAVFLPRISFLIHNSETSERDNRQCL